MSFLSFFTQKKSKSAAAAKERLQIILAHERNGRSAPDFLPMLQKELMAVVAKYVQIGEEQINVSVERAGETSVLEINIELGQPVAR